MKKTISILLILVVVLSSFVLAEANGIKVEVNNQEIAFDVEPITIVGLPLVPLSAIFEASGLKVSWDDDTKTVTGKIKDRLMRLHTCL